MHKFKSSKGSRGNSNCLVVRYMNDQNKMWTFMLEFHVHSISPLHSKDFQLLWFSSHDLVYELAQAANALCVSTVH